MTQINHSEKQRQLVELAVNRGIQRYLTSRRELVDSFVEQNYSLSPAWQLNKKAFGMDMLKTPANILWTPPYFVLNLTGRLLKNVTKDRWGNALTKLPAGFKTDVEQEVAWRVHSQFLELPYQQEKRSFEQNRMLAFILEEDCLNDVFGESLQALAQFVNDPKGQQRLADNLTNYVDSRKAAAELSAAMISMASGYIANKSVNFGALGLGNALAASMANTAAASNFVLGNTLGSLYYSVFSATASKTSIAISTGGVAIVLGIISSYAGVLTDPLQKSLGWHQKKLHKVVDAIEQQFLSDDEQALSYKDGYVARILDIADLMLTVAIK